MKDTIVEIDDGGWWIQLLYLASQNRDGKKKIFGREVCNGRTNFNT